MRVVVPGSKPQYILLNLDRAYTGSILLMGRVRNFPFDLGEWKWKEPPLPELFFQSSTRRRYRTSERPQLSRLQLLQSRMGLTHLESKDALKLI